MSRSKARFATALLLEAWLGFATAASTSGASTVDANAEVAAVLYAASATQAALSKSVDAQLRSQQDRIAALAAEVKAGDSRHRAEMIAAQQAFVAELAAKDRQYAVQIGVFRSTVTDIASTPEGASALERFNAGDEVGAISILDRLRATNERMREARAKLEDAAEGRRIALLAVEARKRGKITTQAVIARFEEVVRLDPGEFADWRQLDLCYQDAGQLADARQAVESLVKVARDDGERSTAFADKSDVLQALGDLSGARTAAEQALALSRRVAAGDAKKIDPDFTLSRTLLAFGEVARRQGDFPVAQKAYVEEIGISRRRLSADPNSVAARSVLTGDLLHLADVLIQRGDTVGARAALDEDVVIERQLIAEAPDNMVFQRQLGVDLMWMSDLLVSQGAFDDARKANAEIVATATKLTATDPANAILQRDLTFGLNKTANLLRIQGNYGSALQTFERALAISRELARPDAASVTVKQDVGTGLSDIGNVKYLLHDFDGSRQAADEAITVLRALVAADPSDATSKQFLAAALHGLGKALTAKGDYKGAHKAFDEGLALDKALVASNSDAAEVLFDTSMGQLGMGTLLNAQGDHAGALVALEKSLEIRRRFAASHPGSSAAERGVAEVMRALVDTPRSKVGWAEFRNHVEEMDRKGLAWPADHAWLEEAQQHAPAGGTP